MCSDPFQALEDVICCEADRLLSSGLKQSAMEGSELLNQLIKQADDRLIIMPGAGINADNILELKGKTGADEYHMTANSLIEGRMTYRKENIKMGGKLQFTEFTMSRTDIDKVKAICERKVK